MDIMYVIVTTTLRHGRIICSTTNYNIVKIEKWWCAQISRVQCAKKPSHTMDSKRICCHSHDQTRKAVRTMRLMEPRLQLIIKQYSQILKSSMDQRNIDENLI